MKNQNRILILDDDPATRDYLAHELEEAGHEPLPMESKRAAYDLLLTWKPDMIITDIKSPDMNGWQFLKWVRASPFARRIKIVVMTGQNGLRSASKAAELGAKIFVNKPFDLAKLLEAIRKQFANQEEPVWEVPAFSGELIGSGPLYTLPWDLLVERWQEALHCSPYRTGVLGMADWRLDFVVDDGVSLTVGRLCRPPDPTQRYAARRYDAVLDGYGVERGLFYILGPRRDHLNNSSRSIIAPVAETEEGISRGVFAPDLSRFDR